MKDEMQTGELTTTPDTEPLKKQAGELMTQTRALKIVDGPTFQMAAEIAKSWKALVNEITEKFKDPKDFAHKAHKAITALESELLSTPRNGEQIIKLAIGNYQMEQDRIRRAEEQRLAAEAQKRREEEQIEEAAQLEAAGEHEAAAEVIERPVAAPVVSLPKPTAAGVSTAMVKTWRIVDQTKLKPAYLIPDEKAIGALVKSMGERAMAAVGEGAIVVEEKAQVRVSSR